MNLLLGGDVMCGRGIDQVLAHPGPPRLFERWVEDARDYVRLAERANGPVPRPVGPAYVWGDALDEMDRRRDALRIVNLETAITAVGEPWPGKGIHYRMHPANVDILRAARIDGCSLANNHVLDWGRAGLVDTLDTLEGVGIACAGAGPDERRATEPAVLQRDAGRVLLSAWACESSGVPAEWAATASSSGVALLPALTAAVARDVADRIAAARPQGACAVVSVHWGGNWGFDIPAAHRTFARALIDLGAADVVHGHSSHHPLPVEVYRGRPILYGCGDLLNDYEGIEGPGNLRCDATCLYALALAASGELQSLHVVPLQLRRFQLVRADAPARRWLRGIFDERGKTFGTGVADASDESFELRWRH